MMALTRSWSVACPNLNYATAGSPCKGTILGNGWPVRAGALRHSARVAAYSILLSVSTGRDDLSAAIAEARTTLADERDRALAMEIAAGTERWRGTIDHFITHFARRPADRMDVEVVVVLRLSLYQLLYLTRVPASAVVDDAVKLTRRCGHL